MKWTVTRGDKGYVIIRQKDKSETIIGEVPSVLIAMEEIAGFISVGDSVDLPEGYYTVGPILKGLQ